MLDLRNNPGGLLRAAVEASALFLAEGKRVVSTRGRNQKEEIYDAHPPQGFPQGSYPIAILVNRYSASAAEILAAALQDHARAIIIGERSYGKGSVQNVIPMENGVSALKLTTASYWRPSNKNIHRFPDSKEEEDWGVRPTDGFEVKLKDEERLNYFRWRAKRDIVRRPGEPLPKPVAEEDAVPADFRDRVLDKAVEHLREQIKKGVQQGAVPPAAPVPAAQRILPPVDVPAYHRGIVDLVSTHG